MELQALKQLWKEQDQKLDQMLFLNQKLVREINLKKVKSKLNTVLPIRILEAAVFLIIVVALGNFIADNISNFGLAASAIILDIFAIIGLVGSGGQIVLIAQVDYSGPVTVMQKQLKMIQTHHLQFYRLALLSFPFYMAYIFIGCKIFLRIDLIPHGNPAWLIANFVFSTLLFIPTIWLYRQLSFKKPVKGWVKKIAQSWGGDQVDKAAVFLHEIEDFKQES